MQSNKKKLQFPEMIDFAKTKPLFKENTKTDENNSWVCELGYIPFEDVKKGFNASPELCSFFHFIKRYYQIDTAVETGTYKASTTIYLSAYFKKVHTIEFYTPNYNEAVENLKNCNNVQIHLGSSQNILKKILPELQNEPVFFYLDAHGNNYWPLLEELKEISKSHKDNCIIVIDDCLVPGRPDIPYDSYGINECSYNYFKEELKNVFTEYSCHYLIPEDVNKRAKFMAVPVKWRSL